jgi:hypothetical protein
MIPSRLQIRGFIVEIMKTGGQCPEFHEICQDIADEYQVSFEEMEDVIWDCYIELKEKYRVKFLHSTNGWGRGRLPLEEK